MADPASKPEIVDAQQAWDNFEINTVRDVSWLGIAPVKRSTRPFDQSAELRSLVSRHLAQAFPEECGSLAGAAVVCGDMAGEQHKFQGYDGIRFASVDGFDISPVSLDRFRTDQFDFRPHVADCNTISLPAGAYHLIVGLHGIHHIENVAHLLDQCHRALKPGGLMLIEEYIGPARLQIPVPNLPIARLLLRSLFRRTERTNHEGRVKGQWIQYPPEAFDPSEAVNAPAIPAEFARRFQCLYRLEYGGLCYPVFEGLGRNFPVNPDFLTRLRIGLVILAERVLQGLGIVKPLFLFAIARPK